MSGTLAWTIPPALKFRYCAEGGGTGCPGVPTERGAFAPGSARRASSAVVIAAGSDAKRAFVGWNRLVSAGAATVSDAASFVMYAVRLPGSGWLLIHCGPPPPFDSRLIVSNMRARSRGSYPARAMICAPSRSACFSKSRL